MTQPLRIGVAGLGTVGGGVLGILSNHADLMAARAGRSLSVTAVSARDRSRDRGLSLDGLVWHDDAVSLAADPNVDLVVELIGGDEGPARALADATINAGKPFVTANKALIAKHGNALATAAVQAGAPLRFEAAVAGGIPIIKGLSEGLAANRISRVYGILNGTCNYILTEMEETGAAFGDVLADAQELGYAEADPTFDVDGIDAGHKLAILSCVAFGVPIDFDSVYCEGIRQVSPQDIEFAEELGYRIKLLGVTELSETGLSQRVHPCLVSRSSAIASVSGVTNAVVAEGDAVGEAVFEGPGAGAGPTASAVVADIIDIARGNIHPALSPGEALPTVPVQDRIGRYYLRLAVEDKPGALAQITATLSDQDISMEELLQRQPDRNGRASIVMTTHETVEAKMMQARDRIAKLAFITEPPDVIRIESF
ncbi:MAG: homoserine dehydrogenase [Alphaproteobacteria bacterium]